MQRMVMQYAGEHYLSTHRRNARLQSDYAALSRNLAAWRARIDSAWPRIEVRSVSNDVGEIPLGDQVQISARVFLDSLTPEDVSVQILSGRVDASSEIKSPEILPMLSKEKEGSGCYRFEASLHTPMR